MVKHRSPESNHFDEEMREHFWTDEEERHSTETIEGEGKVYETLMHNFLTYLKQRVHESETEDTKKEAIERLVDEIPKKIFDYIKTRVDFRRAAEHLRAHGAIAKAGLKEADTRRRFAHEALLDSIAIATRNVVQHTRDAGTIPEEMRTLVDTMQGDYRNIVANAAIDYAWEFLDKEEWERNHQPSTKKEAL